MDSADHISFFPTLAEIVYATKVWDEGVVFYKLWISRFLRVIIHYQPDWMIMSTWWNSWENVPDPFEDPLWFSIVALVFALGAVFAYFSVRQQWEAYVLGHLSNVTVHWGPEETPNRVGTEVKAKIFFINHRQPLDISHVTAKALVQGHGEELVTHKSVNAEEGCAEVTFVAEKAGKYTFELWYRGKSVKGSPFCAMMEPWDLDPSKSYLIPSSPTVIVHTKLFKILIVPHDQFGNPCPSNNDNMRRLKFNAVRIQDSGISADDNFKMSLGINREDSSDDSRGPLYCFYGKCFGVGEYWATITLEDTEIGSVSLLCITDEEDKQFEKLRQVGRGTFLVTRPNNGNEENEDEGEGAEGEDNEELQMDITPRFLSFSKPLNGILEIEKIFRMEPALDVEVIMIDHQSPGLWDGVHVIKIIGNPELCETEETEVFEMEGKDARVFLAIFQKYQDFIINELEDVDNGLYSTLVDRTFTTEGLMNRMTLFYKEVMASIDKLDEMTVGREGIKVLTVERMNIVESTFEATKKFSRLDWGKPFLISFRNESVMKLSDSEDSWEQWGKLLIDDLFEPNAHGLFVCRNSGYSKPGLIHPNPAHSRNPRWESLELYELAGKVLAKFVIESARKGDQFTVKARLSRTLLAAILQIAPTTKHIEIDDPTTYESIPKGVNCLTKYQLLGEVKAEMAAFAYGVTALLPPESLRRFDEYELELVLCGASPLSLKAIQLHHHGSSFSEGFPQIDKHQNRVKTWFWRVLEGMTPLEVGRFHQFLTGSSILPFGGFSQFPPKITLSAFFGNLPKANRNSWHLILNDQPNYEDFRKKFMKALNQINFNIP